MKEPTPTVSQGWPEGPFGTLLLIVLVFLILADPGRSAPERLTVAVGAIRLRPPTLVPLGVDDAETAAQLLGGVLSNYLTQPDEGPTA